MRRFSGYGWNTKRRISRDAIRREVLDNVNSISDEIIDAPSDENKVSIAMTNIGEYEEEWVRFPRTASSVALLSPEKLPYNLA